MGGANPKKRHHTSTPLVTIAIAGNDHKLLSGIIKDKAKNLKFVCEITATQYLQANQLTKQSQDYHSPNSTLLVHCLMLAYLLLYPLHLMVASV